MNLEVQNRFSYFANVNTGSSLSYTGFFFTFLKISQIQAQPHDACLNMLICHATADTEMTTLTIC